MSASQIVVIVAGALLSSLMAYALGSVESGKRGYWRGYKTGHESGYQQGVADERRRCLDIVIEAARLGDVDFESNDHQP